MTPEREEELREQLRQDRSDVREAFRIPDEVLEMMESLKGKSIARQLADPNDPNAVVAAFIESADAVAKQVRAILPLAPHSKRNSEKARLLLAEECSSRCELPAGWEIATTVEYVTMDDEFRLIADLRDSDEAIAERRVYTWAGSDVLPQAPFFCIAPIRGDKEVEILGPGRALRLMMPYDDAGFDEVNALADVVIDMLNEAWPKYREKIEAKTAKIEEAR